MKLKIKSNFLAIMAQKYKLTYSYKYMYLHALYIRSTYYWIHLSIYGILLVVVLSDYR